jgi:plasmid stabilization system protein ParE
MDFRVELSEQAQRDVAAIYDWLQSQQAGDAGERWFLALRAAVASLTNLPSRCPLAPENRDSLVEVRHLLYGRRPHVYQILFTAP